MTITKKHDFDEKSDLHKKKVTRERKTKEYRIEEERG